MLTTPRHFAYFKIAEGCDRPCSFCAIPLMRGKHVSRSIEDLVTEAKNIARPRQKRILIHRVRFSVEEIDKRFELLDGHDPSVVTWKPGSEPLDNRFGVHLAQRLITLRVI